MTSAENNGIPTQQARVVLEQCALLAKCIRQLAEAAGNSAQDTLNELVCIEQLAAQLGYQADRGLTALGHAPSFGDAEDWMMPPTFFAGMRRP